MANFWDELNAQAQQQAALGANHSWDAYNAALQAQTPKKSTKKTKNFWLDQISTAGGILGGIGGSLLSPIAGTAAGAGAGSALGEAIENAIMGEDLGKNVLQEGALGAVFGAGPIKLMKGAVGGGIALAKGAGASAATQAASKAAMTPLRQSIGKGLVNSGALSVAQDKAATNLLKLTPSQTQKLLDAGIDPTQLAKRAAQFGGSAADIIGKTGKGGPLQDTIKALEDGISQTAKTAGSNIRISGDEIISALKTEAKAIRSELGGGARLKAINQIIKDAEKKYSKGITVKQARDILREGNQRFGASVLDDTGDAIARSAQKLEANTMRNALKTRFPGIGTALDNQSELIQLRSILQRARAIDKTGKWPAGRLDITRPGTFIDPIINSRPVSQRLLGGAGGGGGLPPGIGGGAGGSAISEGAGAVLKQNPYGIAARLGTVGALTGLANQPKENTLEGALMGQSLQPDGMNNSNASPSTITNTNIPSNNQNISSSYNQSPQPSNPFGISSDKLAQAMMLALMNNDTDSFGQLKMLYDIVGTSEKANASKTYNSAVSGTISDFQSSLDELNKMESTISSGSGGTLDPIMGTLRSMNPYDTEQQTLQAMINKTRQIVGKALEGGVLRKEDEEKYKKILPTVGDTTEVALNKIAMIKAQLQAKLQNYSSLVGNGENATDLTSALLQAGGAY